MSRYLNDKCFKVFDKVSDNIIREGAYEKPNWVLNFRVKRYNEDKITGTDTEYDTYCCRAVMVKDDEIPKNQSK